MRKPQRDPDKVRHPSELDGFPRTAGEEEEIDRAFAALNRSRGAKACLAYLRGITINKVHGPLATDAELRHREGMRHVVSIIEQRIKRGQR